MERERGTFIMETLGLIIVLPWLCPVSLLRLHYCDDDRWRYQLNPYMWTAQRQLVYILVKALLTG